MSVEPHRIPFRTFREERPGGSWSQLFTEAWPPYRRWFLGEGEAARPSRARSEAALRHHMPELVPIYEALVELAGGDELAARFLAHYCPAPYLSGCSQLVWSRPEPVLIRNYDYRPDLWEATLVHTAWQGVRVIAMSEVLWGVLDGMNEHGLAVSLAFGGRRVVGAGFGIPLVLRYVLQTCATVAQAADVLRRVPTHMAYNVSVVDARGSFATVQVSPDRPAVVLSAPVATNHQGLVEWHQHARMTSTTERERFLSSRIADPHESPERLEERFLEPPLFSRDYDNAFGTLYTAAYRPARGEVRLRWRDQSVEQSFESFEDQTVDLEFEPIPASPATQEPAGS
ncbi:MAG: C45 family peptidase [Planctomycetota bacterium]